MWPSEFLLLSTHLDEVMKISIKDGALAQPHHSIPFAPRSFPWSLPQGHPAATLRNSKSTSKLRFAVTRTTQLYRQDQSLFLLASVNSIATYHDETTGHSGSKERLNAPLSQYHSVSTSFDFSKNSAFKLRQYCWSMRWQNTCFSKGRLYQGRVDIHSSSPHKACEKGACWDVSAATSLHASKTEEARKEYISLTIHSALGKFTGRNTHDLCRLTSWASHYHGLPITQHATICKHHVRARPSQREAPEFRYDVAKTHWAQLLYKVGTWPTDVILTIMAPERHLTAVPRTEQPVRWHSAKGAVCQACQPEFHPWNPQGRQRGQTQMLSFDLYIK